MSDTNDGSDSNDTISIKQIKTTGLIEYGVSAVTWCQCRHFSLENEVIMNEIYKVALSWIEKGYSVLPLRYRSKLPDGHLLPKNDIGDSNWEVFKTQQPTIDDLNHWFPGCLHNIALVTGYNNSASGSLVVIDFDNWDAYLLWQQLTGIQTYMVKTRRGMHCYFKIKEPCNNQHTELLDIKAHGYVLIPPSVHPSGFVYSCFLDCEIKEVEKLTQVLPDGFLPEKQEAVGARYATVVRGTTPADANDPWASAESPESDGPVERAKKVSILSLMPQAKRKSSDGRWYVCPCPFHDDNNPSFWIDTVNGLCGCHSGCTDKPLDVVGLYSRLHGISNREAIFELARNAI
jgi:hypothetical protein